MLALYREDVWQSLVKHHFLGVFVFRSSNGNISIGISWASFSLFTNALFGCWYPRFCLFCGRLPPLTMFLLIITCSRLVDYWFHKNSSHQIEKRWSLGEREMFEKCSTSSTPKCWRLFLGPERNTIKAFSKKLICWFRPNGLTPEPFVGN